MSVVALGFSPPGGLRGMGGGVGGQITRLDGGAGPSDAVAVPQFRSQSQALHVKHGKAKNPKMTRGMRGKTNKGLKKKHNK